MFTKLRRLVFFDRIEIYFKNLKALIKDILKQFNLLNEEKLKSLIKIKESEINYSKIICLLVEEILTIIIHTFQSKIA